MKKQAPITDTAAGKARKLAAEARKGAAEAKSADALPSAAPSPETLAAIDEAAKAGRNSVRLTLSPEEQQGLRMKPYGFQVIRPRGGQKKVQRPGDPAPDPLTVDVCW